MSLAWEVHDYDIESALESLGLKSTPSHISDARDEIDYDAVESAALSSTDFDEQCKYAQEELKRQLSEAYSDEEQAD